MINERPKAEKDAYAEGVNAAMTTVIDLIDSGHTVEQIKHTAEATQHMMGCMAQEALAA